MNAAFWRGRRVFITGHTGFKGSWLGLWLQHAGAQVYGYATAAPTTPNLYTVAGVQQGMAGHTQADIRDGAALADTMRAAAPEVVLHLAAQPLVRQSYADPVETYAVNVLGTVHLLEAVRSCPSVRAVLNVTTDKCYENREWVWGYRENDALGGRDPYSSSKACSELVTSAYRASFFGADGPAVASARAGNVIGGGDWADDRLIPDFFRAHDQGRSVEIRHPDATRPWQHVLEPLSGYLMLAERLAEQGKAFASAWNFGPSESDARSVRWILDQLCERLPGATWRQVGGPQVHESNLLRLDSSRATNELQWAPRWNLPRALQETVAWHRAWRDGEDMRALCLRQIDAFVAGTPGLNRHMASLTVTATALPGLHVVQRKRLDDARGFFSRLFCAEELASAGFTRPVAQINHTLTRRRGAVRGLHFQHPPHAEDKFVSCLRGEVFDVAVDLRRDSPTFMQWHAERLSADNQRSLLIPQGFAHGFQALSDDCELLYLHSTPYAAHAEGALNVRDPALVIAWPLPIAELSPRDAAHAYVVASFTGI